VFSPRLRGRTVTYPLSPLGALALSRAMDVCVPHSSTETKRLGSTASRSARPRRACAPRPALGLASTFLSGQPPGRRVIARPTVAVADTLTPRASSNASRCSSSVRRSWLPRRCAGNHPSSCAPFTGGRPRAARFGLDAAGLAAPLEPALDGGHGDREGFGDFLPRRPAAVDGSTLMLTAV
jgi:hypothetical protein